MQAAIQHYRSYGGERFVVNKTFELIDKAADCKYVLDYLREENYAAFVRYHREHGDLNVPYKPDPWDEKFKLVQHIKEVKTASRINPNHVNKDRIIRVRVTAEESERFQQRAKEKGYKSVSGYIRALAADEKDKKDRFML